MRLRLRPNRTESGWFAPTRAVSGKTANSGQKKKKRCKTYRLNLITNPKRPKLSHAFSLHSNFSSLSFISLCCHDLNSLPLCAVCSLPLCLWDTQPLNHTQSHSQLTHNLTNPLSTSSLNSQAWPALKSLNSGIKLKLSILVFQFF